MLTDSGELSGDLIIFGGVYSNLQALDALLNRAGELNIPPSNMICTGDIAGYCSQPEECIQLIKKLGIRSIAGNVELQLREGAEDCGCNFAEGSKCDGYSKIWYPYTQSKITQNSIDWLKTLPEIIQFNIKKRLFTVVHGSYSNVSQFIFKSTDWQVKKTEIEKAKTDIILAGHSGIPFSDYQNNKYWVNAGVIGMPANNGKNHVYYLVIKEKTQEITIEHLKLSYDYELTAQLMEENALPEEYSKTIQTGIWDNCDILPEKEAQKQGQELQLPPIFIAI